MSLVAVCPKCGLENSPMNTVCDACDAPLGTELAPPKDAPLRPWGSFVQSAGITFSLGLVTAIAGLPIAVIALSAFYGPLIASWRARQNVVGLAALGALAAGAFMFLCAAIAKWSTVKALVFVAINSQPRHFDEYVHHEVGAPVWLAVLIGLVIMAAAAAPTALVGASVGELLATRRRASKQL